MKKFIVYISVLALTLPFFTSCESMLEEEVYGQQTVDEMMANESNVVLLVGQAYADIKWTHDHWGYWGVSSLTADECVCPVRMPGEHWSDGGYWRNLNTHRWNEFGDAFKNIWNTTIQGAVLCNKLIATLDSAQVKTHVMSEHVYNQYVGELEVLRTYYYFNLFECFGRIPYTETFDEKDNAKPLAEPYQVWSYLVASLEKNAPNLPIQGAPGDANYGRCTQGMAYTLLARLYLNAPSYGCTPENIDKTMLANYCTINSETDFYQEAARCCENVISSGAYKIADNFFDNFLINNEKSPENIFVIIEDGRDNFDSRSSGSMSNKLRVNLLTLHYCHETTYSMQEKPWNGFCARPKFIQRYNEEDVRGYGNEGKGTMNEKQWGWFVGPVCDAEGKQLKDQNDTVAIIRPTIKSLTEATWNDGARMIKYEIDKVGTYHYCENDFVLLRYADVLWMNEEARMRGATNAINHMSDADFQTMLERTFAYSADPMAAFKAAYGDPAAWTLDDILDERGREFAWEMVRRRDLIRFDKFNDASYVDYLASGLNSTRNWFPIPYSVLEKAERDENGNAIWTQNPGY